MALWGVMARRHLPIYQKPLNVFLSPFRSQMRFRKVWVQLVMPKYRMVQTKQMQANFSSPFQLFVSPSTEQSKIYNTAKVWLAVASIVRSKNSFWNFGKFRSGICEGKVYVGLHSVGFLLISGMCRQSYCVSIKAAYRLTWPDLSHPDSLHLAKWPESFKAQLSWGRDVLTSCRVCQGQKCLLTFINYKWVCGETKTTAQPRQQQRPLGGQSVRHTPAHVVSWPQPGMSCDDGKYCNTNKVGNGLEAAWAEPPAHDSATGQHSNLRWDIL